MIDLEDQGSWNEQLRDRVHGIEEELWPLTSKNHKASSKRMTLRNEGRNRQNRKHEQPPVLHWPPLLLRLSITATCLSQARPTSGLETAIRYPKILPGRCAAVS